MRKSCSLASPEFTRPAFSWVSSLQISILLHFCWILISFPVGSYTRVSFSLSRNLVVSSLTPEDGSVNDLLIKLKRAVWVLHILYFPQNISVLTLFVLSQHTLDASGTGCTFPPAYEWHCPQLPQDRAASLVSPVLLCSLCAT